MSDTHEANGHNGHTNGNGRPRLPVLTAAQAVRLPKPPPIRLIDRYRPFPAHLLPPPMDEYVQEVARSMGCDVANAALPAIAIAGAANGNSAVIEVKPGYTQPSVFWTIIVAYSGSSKSPPQKAVSSYLIELQQRSLAEFMRQHRDYLERLKDYEAARAEARSNKSIQVGEAPVAPRYERFLTQDVTIEAQRRNLRDNYPRPVLIIRDELKGWFVSAARYKSGASGQDETEWLPFWNAEPIIADRKVGDDLAATHINIPAAHCPVTGPITPNTLRELASPRNLGAGVFARFLLVMPPRRVKVWNEDFVAPDLEGAWRRVLDKLYAQEGDFRDGQWRPHLIRLSPAAKALWVEWFGPFARRQVAAGENEVGAALSKLEAYCLRFVLLHHVVRCAHRGDKSFRTPIEPDSVKAGIGLTEWFEHEAFRIYDWLRADGASADSQWLLDYVRAQGGRVALKAMRDSLRRRFPSREALREALQPLVDAGWVELAEERAGNGRAVEMVVAIEREDAPDDDPEPAEVRELGEAERLAFLWCEECTRFKGGEKWDKPEEVLPELQNLLDRGWSHDVLAAEIRRPTRDKGEFIYRFKLRVIDPAKHPEARPARQPETPEQRRDRLAAKRQEWEEKYRLDGPPASFRDMLRAHRAKRQEATAPGAAEGSTPQDGQGGAR